MYLLEGLEGLVMINELINTVSGHSLMNQVPNNQASNTSELIATADLVHGKKQSLPEDVYVYVFKRFLLLVARSFLTNITSLCCLIFFKD